MIDIRNTKLCAVIKYPEIAQLINELEFVCGLRSARYLDLPFRLYLTQCVYPNGTGTKRVAIQVGSLLPDSLLETQVGKLPTGILYDLCTELSVASGAGIEFSHRPKFFAFLNRTIDKHAPTKPPTERQRRINNLVRTRRDNKN